MKFQQNAVEMEPTCSMQTRQTDRQKTDRTELIVVFRNCSCYRLIQ